MEIVNLTPHVIVVKNGEFEKVYEPSGFVARVELIEEKIGELDSFPIFGAKVAGNNLPAPEVGKRFLVSAMILALAKELGRDDCLAPATNQAERNDKGHIVSVPGFVS